MQMTFRWFGKDLDTVSLEQIKQIPGCSRRCACASLSSCRRSVGDGRRAENVRRNHGSRLDDGMYRKRKCSRGY